MAREIGPEETTTREIVNLERLEESAAAQLPKPTYDYVAGGAGEEWTLRENRAAWRRLAVVNGVLRGKGGGGISTATTVLGTPIALPVVVPPMGFQGLLHPEAERATARGTAAAGTLLAASTASSCSLEEIAAASAGAKWFQLYPYKDAGISRELIERAAAAGYRALVVTVDTAVAGDRERDRVHRFTLPPGLRFGNLPADRQLAPGEVGSALHAYIARQWKDDLSYADVERFRSWSELPIVLKGILAPRDARIAAESGVAAVWVSNHGGRQLDGSPATATVLPHVVDAVAGKAEVYVDGGIRRAIDVLRALACGARACMVGRPILWALALDGAAGVEAVLGHLREELVRVMTLCGCDSVEAIGRDLLWPPPSPTLPLR